MANIRWGYAVNQWRNMEVDLVRRDQFESAFKVISVCGFRGLEITDSAVGGPDMIPAFFGSTHRFMDFLNDCGLDCVCSFFSGLGGGSATDRADHARLADAAGRLADFIVELGASCLVVRPMNAYSRESPVTEEKIKIAAEGWSKVGQITKLAGIQTALHPDFLCGVRNQRQIEQLLKWSDPDTVGLAMDTAEFTIAGIDPVKFFAKHHSRVKHLHFKDALTTDTLGEYKNPTSEVDYWPTPLITAGAKRQIERWFYEMGTPGGLVDFPALLKSMEEHNYDGWAVVESDQSPHVEESVMLNGWYRKQVLSKL
jgi:inosose dehydratase